MLAALLARYSAQGGREIDRYAAWSAALQQLRQDWESSARPDLRQLGKYLENVGEDQRADALQDIIAEHLRLTWRHSTGKLVEDYVASFGQEYAALASSETVAAELVEDEFLARYQLPHGDQPSLNEYRRRFPARADVMELLGQRCLDGGRFVKLHQRGLGAMGEVWEAHDHRTGGRGALKEPSRTLPDKAGAIRWFAEEARVMAGLEHPGIVALREHQPADGSAPCYVMRLIDGESLSQWIHDFHLPPAERTPHQQRECWRRLLNAFVMVCDAMTYAHARGVLHRDLKPGNVALEYIASNRAGEEPEMRAVILDWGMATKLSKAWAWRNDGTSAEIAGTPDYMPPEQADGRADVRSDVFGLGAILYEILTGRSPQGWTDGARPADWRRVVRQAQFHPPRQFRPPTPRALEAICLKALARDPEERYQSAADLAVAMRRYLAGDPVSAAPFWIRACRRLRTLVGSSA